LEIRKHPEPVLRKKSKDIHRVTNREKELIGHMVETMYESRGIGLAAPQVGISKRIAVVDAGDGLLKMINPTIIERKGASRLEEGCLSVSGAQVEVERAEEITVSFLDEVGKRITKNFKGLTARAVQHEIDHINGKLIIDYLPWYKRLFAGKG
jgi:peptide deformylase